MTHASIDRPRVLMIDLDNCPHEIMDLESNAAHYELIIASHGTQEPRVPLGLAAVIGQLISQGRIEIWAMPAGKNSADFGLTFLAGRLSADRPENTHFEIASKDKDLDHAVGLLRRSGFTADRIDSSVMVNMSVAPAGEVSIAAASLARSLSGNGAKSRPKRKKSLIATARARGATPEIGLAALQELIDQGAIVYAPNGLPTYHDERLKQFATSVKRKRSKSKTEPLKIAKLASKTRTIQVADSSQMRLFE